MYGLVWKEELSQLAHLRDSAGFLATTLRGVV